MSVEETPRRRLGNSPREASTHIAGSKGLHHQRARCSDTRLYSLLLGTLRWEDHLSPGVKGQPGQHSENPSQNGNKNKTKQKSLTKKKKKWLDYLMCFRYQRIWS
jgi:hypothetical protein